MIQLDSLLFPFAKVARNSDMGKNFPFKNFLEKIWRYKKLYLILHQTNEKRIMPTILIAFGLRFYFYSDEHQPIHVHVENADGRAKFLLAPTIELIKNEGIKPSDLKKAQTLCETFQEEFIQKWHEHIDANS